MINIVISRYSLIPLNSCSLTILCDSALWLSSTTLLSSLHLLGRHHSFFQCSCERIHYNELGSNCCHFRMNESTDESKLHRARLN